MNSDGNPTNDDDIQVLLDWMADDKDAFKFEYEGQLVGSFEELVDLEK